MMRFYHPTEEVKVGKYPCIGRGITHHSSRFTLYF
jgi:hypothetical protein